MVEHASRTGTGNVVDRVTFTKAPSSLDIASTNGYSFTLTEKESAGPDERCSIAKLMSVHDPSSLGKA